MNKFAGVRAKTGKFVDWAEVDKTAANTSDIWGLIKRAFNIAIGKKNEAKN